MKISVVCPTYNSEDFVEKTLMSAINQTRIPDEVIIVDDGSSDNTLNILKNIKRNYEESIPFKIHQISHGGPGKARNEGIAISNYEWIAFLDSDDFWYRNKLERVENEVNKCAEINFLCHDEMLIKKDGDKKMMLHSTSFNESSPLKKQLFYANFISTSTVVCKKSLIIENCFFDESLMSAQDYDLWLRLSPQINLKFIKEILGNYVERKGNITSGNLRLRFLNDIRISFKHRFNIPISTFLLRFIRIFLSYIKQLIFRIF